ncbi:hypothetical protein BC829DRAFT_366178, partial [Chytridium lagenaria]
LLHLGECIRYLGPPTTYWQFPMERLCGLLLPMTKSRKNPVANLAKNIKIWMQVNILIHAYGMLLKYSR